MSELDTVQSYLDGLQGEGEIQSRGKFTLDPKQSRVKIAEMQSQDLSSWACWWIRSAVNLGAAGGTIQCGRDLLTARFLFDCAAPGLRRVEAFLLRGDESADDRGLELLRSALLWTQSLLESRPTLEGSLLLERPNEPLLLLRLRADSVELQHSPQMGKDYSLSLNVQDTRPRGSGAGELLPLRMALASRLPARLAFCPIPVSLDGVWLNSGTPAGAANDALPLIYLRYYLCPRRANVLAVKDPRCWPARHYHLLSSMPERFSRPRMSTPTSRVNTLSLAGEVSEAARWSHSAGTPMLKWRGGFPEALYLSGHEPLRAEGWSVGDHPPWLVRVALFRVADSPVDNWAVMNNGLCLDWEPLQLSESPNGWGWQAVVGMDSAATDISGVKALRNETFTRVQDWLRGEIVELHRRQSAEMVAR